MAVTAMRRLGLTARATPVVLGGGMMTARDPLLLQEITERITAAPATGGTATTITVAWGADAERRLRAAYDGRAWS